MNLAQTIQYLRKKSNLTQEQLASKLGISKQSISKWESELSAPDIEKVVLLSEIFGVTTDYLLKNNNKCSTNTVTSRQSTSRKQYIELINKPEVTYCEYKKGATIIEQGEKVDYIYYLVSGTCYRRSITEKGDILIFDIKEPSSFINSLLGVFALYTEDKISVGNSIVARTMCYCYRIPKETFYQYAEDKPEVLTELLKLYGVFYKELFLSYLARQEGKVPNRLCKLLFNNAEIKGEKLIVNKKFSNNAEISRYLGIHRVTVMKILKALKNKGIILKEKEAITILNKEELLRYVEAEKILEYK